MASFVMLSLTASAAAASRLRLTPAVILCGSWTVIVLLQSLFAPRMYNSGAATLAIFSISASFLLGEMLARDLFSPSSSKGDISGARGGVWPLHSERRLRTVVILFGISAILGMGLYYHTVGLFDVGNLQEAFVAIGSIRVRYFSGELEVPFTSRVGLLFAYSGVVLSLAYWFFFGLRWWLFLAPIAVVLFGIGTSGRAGLIAVLMQWLFTLLLKDATEQKRSLFDSLFVKWAVPMGIAAIAVFFSGQFIREAGLDLSEEALVRITGYLQTYMFGGVSGFAYYMDHLFDWSSLTYGRYSFSSLFAALGLSAQEPGVYDQYVTVSPAGDLSNVYGAYRSFIDDFSIVGACLFYLLSGLSIGAMYRSFLSGNRQLVAVLVPLLSWLAFSPFASLTYFNSFLLSVFLPYMILRGVRKA